MRVVGERKIRFLGAKSREVRTSEVMIAVTGYEVRVGTGRRVRTLMMERVRPVDVKRREVMR